MANFSPFWLKNYKKIGACCITYALEREVEHGTTDKQHVKDYIDVD